MCVSNVNECLLIKTYLGGGCSSLKLNQATFDDLQETISTVIRLHHQKSKGFKCDSEECEE